MYLTSQKANREAEFPHQHDHHEDEVARDEDFNDDAVFFLLIIDESPTLKHHARGRSSEFRPFLQPDSFASERPPPHQLSHFICSLLNSVFAFPPQRFTRV